MAKTVGIGVQVDFHDAKEGFEQIEHSMKKAERGSREFGRILGGLSDDMGAFGRVAGSVLNGLASGGITGAAIGGVLALAESFKEVGKEAAKAAEEWKKRLKEMEEISQKYADKERVRRLISQGMSKEVAEALVSQDMKKIDELVVDLGIKARQAQAQLDKALNSGGNLAFSGLAAKYKETGDSEELVKYFPFIKEKIDAVTEAQRQLNEAEEQGRRIMESAKTDAGTREADERKKAAKEAEQVESQHQQFMNQMAQQGADEKQRIYLETDAALESISKRASGLTKKEVEDEVAAVYQAEDRKLKAYQARLDAEFEAASEAARKDQERKEKEMQRGTERALAEMKQFNTEVERVAADIAKPFTDVVHGIGSAFHSMFMSILQGGQKLGDIMKNFFMSIASTVLGTLIQMGVQAVTQMIVASFADQAAKTVEVQRAAGLTFANTMASVSAIPIVGPFMAPEMAAANMALVEATAAPLAAAAGGWDLPQFSGGTPAILHSREMVLPQDLADNVRAMTGNGGNTYIINAMDTKSFDDYLRRNQGALRSNLRDMSRKGRL